MRLKGTQPALPLPVRKVLYWEFHEGGFSQAVLMDGRWKAIRSARRDAPVQLFDLQADIAESTDLAAAQPELLARARSLFVSERTDSPHWPVRDKEGKPGKPGK